MEYADLEEEIIRRNAAFEPEPEERKDRISASGGIVNENYVISFIW